MVRTHGQDAGEQQVIDDIARVGWHLVGIADDDEDPGFVYSIGLHHTLGQAEFAILALTLERRLIESTSNPMLRGVRFQGWYAYDDILDGSPACPDGC